MTSVHGFQHPDIDGEATSLERYAGKALLIVNVASRCGLTSQYTGLEALQKTYGPRGLVVLGFPCNQFMGQEPGTEAEIKTFCATEYGVSFPMFSKLEVNGPGRHPLYAWLCAQDLAPEGAGDIQWNFGKFLIGKDGQPLARFSPRVEPESPELKQAIEAAL